MNLRKLAPLFWTKYYMRWFVCFFFALLKLDYQNRTRITKTVQKFNKRFQFYSCFQKSGTPQSSTKFNMVPKAEILFEYFIGCYGSPPLQQCPSIMDLSAHSQNSPLFLGKTRQAAHDSKGAVPFRQTLMSPMLSPAPCQPAACDGVANATFGQRPMSQ